MRPMVSVAVCRVFRREGDVAVESRETAGGVLVMAVLGWYEVLAGIGCLGDARYVTCEVDICWDCRSAEMDWRSSVNA